MVPILILMIASIDNYATRVSQEECNQQQENLNHQPNANNNNLGAPDGLEACFPNVQNRSIREELMRRKHWQNNEKQVSKSLIFPNKR